MNIEFQHEDKRDLRILVELKIQSRNYTANSEFYNCPTRKDSESVQYQLPSSDHSLTTNKIRIK